jgi:signal transduction histidine kinase
MPDGGTLTVRTAHCTVGSGECTPERSAGDYCVLSVADTGCGIREEVLPHIFDPFYTTKEVGKGSGLGLASVYGIVDQSGGHVEVQSRVGRGTTFTVFLPAVEVASSEGDEEKAKKAPPSPCFS